MADHKKLETSEPAQNAIRACADLLKHVHETQPGGLDPRDYRFILDGVLFEALMLFDKERKRK